MLLLLLLLMLLLLLLLLLRVRSLPASEPQARSNLGESGLLGLV